MRSRIDPPPRLGQRCISSTRAVPGGVVILEATPKDRSGSDERSAALRMTKRTTHLLLARLAAEAIDAAGFKPGVGPGPGSAYHVLVASKEMVLLESELAAIRARFDAIATSLSGSYECWTASAVAAPVARNQG